VIHLALAALLSFTLEDTYRTTGFSSPRISPDGKTLLFFRSHVNLDKDRRDSQLVVLDIASHSQRVLKTDPAAYSASWSPDGTRIAFIQDDAKHHGQVFITTLQSDTPQQLTNAPGGVDQYAWRPDGKAIAYVAQDAPPKRTGIAQWQDAFRVTDNGYMHAGPFMASRVYVIDALRQAPLVMVSLSNHGSVAAGVTQSTISWNADGSKLAYVALPNPLLGDALNSTVRIANASSGASTSLTNRSRLEFNPRFSPDGKRLAYTYARAGDPMNEADIFISTGSGAGTDLTLHKLDVNATNYAWYPDSSALLVGAHSGTRNALWRVPLNGPAQRLNLGDVNAIGNFDGSIARDGGIAFVGTEPHHPGEIFYRAPDGNITRLTDDNAAIAQKRLGKVTTLNWHPFDKLRMTTMEDGVLTYPAQYDPHERYPLVLLIHGGPTSASVAGFDELAQLMSARGWFVLSPNYRGSDNLGNAYQHAIYIDATHGPGLDILAGVAAAERTAPIDKHKVCVSGWSYGGMMTSWLITQNHEWACAVSGAAVNDLVYDYSLADDIGDDRASMPGSPFVGNNMAAYRAVSPLTYYRNVRTPTLILSDMYDDRVPAAQSYVFYHALRDNGVPVEFYEWPVHGHFPSDPVRIADVYRYWLDWIARYVK
jgi:dipeptidyl aminopeptidase/acylaminoacyl peptidase